MIEFEYSIATLAGGVAGLTLLSDLTPSVPWPSDDPVPYTVEKMDSDGGVRGLGWPVIQWHWNYLTVPQWNVLRTYCPEKSSDVFIRSFDVDENQEFVNYKCKMVWPTGRPMTVGKVIDFTIIFQALELQGDYS